MRIAEVFHSIQGEGRFSGTPSVFLRTTGCNLRCVWCDTDYTSWQPEGRHLTVVELLERVVACECPHVVITGGEPLLQRDVVPLTEALREYGCHITIETAGTVFRPVVADLMSISPKRPNSTPWKRSARWAQRHERLRENPHVVAQMLDRYDYQLKFVIDSPDDLEDVERYLELLPQAIPENVWLMPQGVNADELREKEGWLIPAAEERGYRFCPRLHIEHFGNTRGT